MSADEAGAGWEVRPLTPERMDDLAAVTRGSWGATCFCMFPRLTDRQYREGPGDDPPGEWRRQAMTRLSHDSPSPGLLAYDDDGPAGWVAVGPRAHYARIDRSRATPPVDDRPVWVVACITVARRARGRGLAVELIRQAVRYAGQHGAPVVEAHPRAGDARVPDGSAWFGTEEMFHRAGFVVVRGPRAGPPRTWLPRVAMRAVPPSVLPSARVDRMVGHPGCGRRLP